MPLASLTPYRGISIVVIIDFFIAPHENLKTPKKNNQ
jgi:hypothetical protein